MGKNLREFEYLTLFKDKKVKTKRYQFAAMYTGAHFILIRLKYE